MGSLWDFLSIATVREEERTGEGQITEETTREEKGGDDLRRAEESNEHGVYSVLVHPKGGSWQQASLELEAVDGADAYFDVMPTHAHSRTHVETHEKPKLRRTSAEVLRKHHKQKVSNTVTLMVIRSLLTS